MIAWTFEHTYARLPALFHARVPPTAVRDPRMVICNEPLAASLGFDPASLDSQDGASVLGGNVVPDGAMPLAQAYAGHQFGHFTGLGDGRAILLGEWIAPDGRRVDVQLKGAGPTPYSRRGDGRAALAPMLREYVISEAMHALGIPTTRSLAVVATGEPVFRERALPGAVLTRVAGSHLRVGTFEWAAAHRDGDALRALADYTIARHYPDAAAADRPYLALLEAIAMRQAGLVARWQLVGFVHGVMNTDNMSLAGETLDYGPCAFLDVYDPATVFSSIDTQGRYAYGNQPAIAQWNLTRLAEAMLPLFDPDRDRAIELATGVLEAFATRFDAHWRAGLRAKLGLEGERPDDDGLTGDLLAWMHASHADFTETFRVLSSPGAIAAASFPDPVFVAWHDRWRRRLETQAGSHEQTAATMCGHNPAVIARNHRVEAALDAAERGDLEPFRQLLVVLASPYDHTRPRGEYTAPPLHGGRAYRTYCGT